MVSLPCRALANASPHHVYISQDGNNKQVSGVVEAFIASAPSELPSGTTVKHLHHKQVWRDDLAVDIFLFDACTLMPGFVWRLFAEAAKPRRPLRIHAVGSTLWVGTSADF